MEGKSELSDSLEAIHIRMCELIEENKKLKAVNQSLLTHIDKMSCCCAGCTKHNQDIKKEVEDAGEFAP